MPVSNIGSSVLTVAEAIHVKLKQRILHDISKWSFSNRVIIRLGNLPKFSATLDDGLWHRTAHKPNISHSLSHPNSDELTIDYSVTWH